MVYPSQKNSGPNSLFEPMDGDKPFLQFRLWLRSFFLYVWLEVLFINQHLLSYCTSLKYQQEGKKKTYHTLVTYIDAEISETKERCVKICEKWRRMRENTVARVGKVAEHVKVLNDDTIAFQTVCKGISMGAKLSVFGGPFSMLIGAGASVLANIGYNHVSKRQIEELEKMCANVQGTLQRDSEATRELLCVLSEMKQIPEPTRVCIRKFHFATVNGFFDGVPVFEPFVSSVKVIKNIEDPQNMTDFLKILWKETENLKRNPSFKSSFSDLLTCIPDTVELIVVKIPKIICGAAVLYSVVNGVKAGHRFPCVKVLKALNILAMIKDFSDIMGKLGEFDKYPQLSKDLKAIKSKLEQEMEEISEMAKKMQECTHQCSSAVAPFYEDWHHDFPQEKPSLKASDKDVPIWKTDIENLSCLEDCDEDCHMLDSSILNGFYTEDSDLDDWKQGNSSLDTDLEASDLEADFPESPYWLN